MKKLLDFKKLTIITPPINVALKTDNSFFDVMLKSNMEITKTKTGVHILIYQTDLKNNIFEKIEPIREIIGNKKLLKKIQQGLKIYSQIFFTMNNNNGNFECILEDGSVIDTFDTNIKINTKKLYDYLLKLLDNKKYYLDFYDLKFKKFSFFARGQVGRKSCYELIAMETGVHLLEYSEAANGGDKKIIKEKIGDINLLKKIQKDLGEIFSEKTEKLKYTSVSITDTPYYWFECILEDGSIINNKKDIYYSKIYEYLSQLMNNE